MTSFHPLQAYYQWVGLMLVLQAGLSYLPWLAWKRAEGGRVSGQSSSYLEQIFRIPFKMRLVCLFEDVSQLLRWAGC